MPTPSGRAQGEGRLARASRWLRPGMGLKRWLLLIFCGELFVAFAGALVARQIIRALRPEAAGESPLIWLVTLQFLPLVLRPVVLAAVGIAIFAVGFERLMRVVLEPFGRHEEPLVELIYQKRSLARGPRIVAIGGGTGLSTLLRGLKAHTSNITAVVAVADDGGSSGMLRSELGIAPVGDLRNCIAALADAEPTMTRLLQYRFPAAASGAGAVTGHAFGNLLIAALSDIEGDFEEGVRQANRVLAVRGRVVPAAPLPLTLHAELADGSHLVGQSQIARSREIQRVWISPADCHATAEALEAIAAAELIVLGPGSLFTSLLPNLLIPELQAALAAATAPRVYVANVATQVGETEGFSLSDHLTALRAHGLTNLFDAVLANTALHVPPAIRSAATPVRIDVVAKPGELPRLVLRDVIDPDNGHHHDPAKLALALLELLDSWSVAPALGPTVARSA